MTTVGVIGVGELGSRLARRLRNAGYQVLVYDIAATSLANVVDDDVAVAGTVAELAGRCEVVVTCVTDHDSVREVCLGANGVAAAVRPGTVVVDTTTSLPSVSETVAAALTERGAYLLDVPVSRGIPAADQGTLSAMVGGPEETYQATLPLLRTFATDIAHVGDVGAGHAVKLWNMQLMAVHQTELTEALWRAAREGGCVADAVTAFEEGQARTYLTSNHFPRFVLSGTYDSKFTTALMRKDLALSLKLGAELGVLSPLAERALAGYDLACDAGLGPDDNMRLVPFQWALFDGAAPEVAASDARAAGRPPAPDGPASYAAADTALAATNDSALAEVVAAVEAYGMQPEVALSMINASSGASRRVAAAVT